jgi:hypothetical protein
MGKGSGSPGDECLLQAGRGMVPHVNGKHGNLDESVAIKWKCAIVCTFRIALIALASRSMM